MDSPLEDVWYSWLGSSCQSIRYLKTASKDGKRPISKVEEHINNLTQSLSNTQAALERASEAEQEARREHAGCSEVLAQREEDNTRLERQIKRLYEEVEKCYEKEDKTNAEQERLQESLEDLMEQVDCAEREAEENQNIMNNERLLHLQEREALRAVQSEHESCLVSLRNAQNTLIEYQKDIAQRDETIQDLKRYKSKISSKLGYITNSRRQTYKDLNDTKKQLANVSDQLKQAEQIIQTHFTMLSSLEAYKQRLAEELGHLRASYENRMAQLVSMRETLQERNLVTAELRAQLAERDDQLVATKLEVDSTKYELAEAQVALATSQSAVSSVEKDMNDIRDFHTKLDTDRALEIARLSEERAELEYALQASHQENGDLRSELAMTEAEGRAKDVHLAEEIAAHARTTNAATEQKIRLQTSIENLKGNLQKANNDLRKTRETLFALNEKCHSLANAERSLQSYRARSKLLLDNKQTIDRQVPGSSRSGNSDDEPCIQESVNRPSERDTESTNETPMPKASKPRQLPLTSAQKAHHRISDPDGLRKLLGMQAVATSSSRENIVSFEDLFAEGPPSPSVSTFSSLSSLPSPPATPSSPTAPKHVRFSLDEGYQTDEDKALTSDSQMWNIISNLDQARKDFKVLRKRQRRRNLKVELASSVEPGPSQ